MNMNNRTLMALAVAALAIASTGCGLHGKPKVDRKATLGKSGAGLTASAPREPAAHTNRADVVAPGIVEPWGAQVELSAQEPGWISSIAVREGDVVQAGQLLATLEDRGQRHAQELAQAEVAEAGAALVKIETGATSEEFRQAQADVDAAGARASFARAAAERLQSLQLDGTVAKNDAERAASDASAQEAIADRARARLDEIKRGARGEDRDAARAGVAAANAKLRLAAANVARRSVVAPSAGTVLLSRLHPGEFYSPDAGPLLVLGDMTRLQIRLEVDEIDAPDVHVGATCALYSDAGAELARGTVVRLAPKMGRRSLPIESPTARADIRIREVFVEVPATSSLVPGQRVWGHTTRTPGQEAP
jgi:multidrug resistance efflux pump